MPDEILTRSSLIPSRVNRPYVANLTRLLSAALLLCVIGTGCGGSGSQSGNTQPGLAPPPPPAQINSYFGTTGDVWSTSINHTANQVNGEDRTLYGVQLPG